MTIFEHKCKKQHNGSTRRRGSSSFHMHDPELLFKELNVQKGDKFLDLGCGAGDYTIRVSLIVGNEGTVYALDQSKEAIESLQQRCHQMKVHNARTQVCNILNHLPFEDSEVDICFVATVLHTLNIHKNGDTFFNEIHRVVKPGGQLITIDCKKEQANFGPPLSMRLAPDEIIDIAEKCGFKSTKIVDLGFNYMIKFISM